MIKKERFKVVSAVHLFLIKKGQILLLRRYNTGYRDGEYSVPAGHLDGEETASQAMIREAKEETNLKIAPGNLKMVHLMHRKAEEERLDFFFTAKKWEGILKINEPNKCNKLKWTPLEKLPKNMIPYVREAIKNYQKNITYSEFGWIASDEK